MDYRELSTLLTKIAGALIVALSVIAYPNYTAMFYAMNVGVFPAFGYSLISSGIPVVIGLCMLLAPSIVTNRLVTGRQSARKRRVSRVEIEVAALAVLGAYFLVRAVADIVYYVVVLKDSVSVVIGLQAIDADTWGGMAATGIELVLGAILLLWAPRIVKLLSVLQARV